MLPSGIAREVLGPVKRRVDAPESQSVQLVGRSRQERLLDGIYNKQVRTVRDIERQRRTLRHRMNQDQGLRYAASRRSQSHASISSLPELSAVKRLKKEEGKREVVEVKPETSHAAVCVVKEEEEEDPDRLDRGKASSVSGVRTPLIQAESSAVSSETGSPPTLQVSNVLANLIKHSGHPAKYEKVVKLSKQLFDSVSIFTEIEKSATIFSGKGTEEASCFSERLGVMLLIKNLLDLCTSLALTAGTLGSTPQCREDLATFTERAVEFMLKALAHGPGNSNTAALWNQLSKKEDKLSFQQFMVMPADDVAKEREQLFLEETREAFLASPVPLIRWLRLLALSTYWRRNLFTDDTFQFHQALAQYSRALENLPARTGSQCTAPSSLTQSSEPHGASSWFPGVAWTGTLPSDRPTLANLHTSLVTRHRVDAQQPSPKAAVIPQASFSLETTTKEYSDTKLSPAAHGEPICALSVQSHLANSMSSHASQLDNPPRSSANTVTCCKKGSQRPGLTDAQNPSSYHVATTSSPKESVLSDSGDAVEQQRLAESARNFPTENACESESLDASLPTYALAYQIQRQLLFGVLPTVFQFSKTRWARPAVSKLFQQLYLDRLTKFTSAEALSLEAWQSDIRRAALDGHGSIGYGGAGGQSLSGSTARRTVVIEMGESANPVRDARDERIFAVHGAAVWSAKQAGL